MNAPLQCEGLFFLVGQMCIRDSVLGDREVPIVPDKRIQEMSFGEFEGLCCREEGWNIPDPGFRNFFNAPEVYQPPKGGESFEEVRARLNNFLEELYQKEDLQDKNVLLSTHGVACLLYTSCIFKCLCLFNASHDPQALLPNLFFWKCLSHFQNFCPNFQMCIRDRTMPVQRDLAQSSTG